MHPRIILTWSGVRGRTANSDDSRPRHPVAESGLVGRGEDQHDADDIEDRQAIDHAQGVPDDALGHADGFAFGGDDADSGDPLAQRGPEEAFEEDKVGDDREQEVQAERIEDEVALVPAMITRLHEPDALDEAGDGKAGHADQEPVQQQGHAANQETGITRSVEFATIV